jgi:hypothetical protein
MHGETSHTSAVPDQFMRRFRAGTPFQTLTLAIPRLPKSRGRVATRSGLDACRELRRNGAEVKLVDIGDADHSESLARSLPLVLEQFAVEASGGPHLV